MVVPPIHRVVSHRNPAILHSDLIMISYPLIWLQLEYAMSFVLVHRHYTKLQMYPMLLHCWPSSPSSSYHTVIASFFFSAPTKTLAYVYAIVLCTYVPNRIKYIMNFCVRIAATTHFNALLHAERCPACVVYMYIPPAFGIHRDRRYICIGKSTSFFAQSSLLFNATHRHYHWLGVSNNT